MVSASSTSTTATSSGTTWSRPSSAPTIESIPGAPRAGKGGYQTNPGDPDTTGPPPTTWGEGGSGGTLSAPGAGGASSPYLSIYTGRSYVEPAGQSGSGGTGGDGADLLPDPLYAFSPDETFGGGGGGGGGYYGGGGGGGLGAAALASRRGGGGGGGSSWSNSTYVVEGAVAFDSANGLYQQGYVLFEWCPPGGIYRDGAVHLS